MTFTIKRSKWLRGDMGESYLYRPEDRKQCCVGQMCNQVGLPNRTLSRMVAVSELIDEGVSVPNPLSKNGVEPFWLKDAYAINDAIYIDDEARERQLRDLAKRNGHRIVFVD